MSKTRSISSLAARLGILAAACWLTTSTFPLSAAPQSAAPGVTIDMRGSTVLHRAAVYYPPAALQAGVQGTVMVEVKLDSSAEVADARVLGGPEELRSAALESVLKWHFTRDAANSVRQVGITFSLPEAQKTAPRAILGRLAGRVPARTRPSLPVAAIDVLGLPPANRDELMAQLPVHAGDTFTPELAQKLEDVVHQYDRHLTISTLSRPDSVSLRITTPEYVPPRGPAAVAAASPAHSDAVPVSGSAQQAKLISKTMPLYPLDAKQARIQGVVQMEAVIAKDGTVKELHALSGHPMLVPAAMQAVQTWVYEPTTLNGKAVSVITRIDVNFTLADGPPPAAPQQQ